MDWPRDRDRDEGKPIFKQLSSSLYTSPPGTLQAYQTVLKIYQIGWLFIQVNTSHRWDRKWAELKDGVFRYAEDQSNPTTSTFIPIENIIRLVTKNDVIVMKTKNEKLQMKTETPSELGTWIFSFQKSVALALMKIREQGPMSYLVSHEDNPHSIGGGTRLRQKSEDWTREEFGGQGHGYQSLVNKTKTTMAEHAASIADARHTYHIGSHESLDDSLTLKAPSWKSTSSALEEVGGPLSKGRPHTPPHSAPSSPLKIYWNADQGSSPDRHLPHYLEHSLGLAGDVVLPAMPMNMTGRETSGASNSHSEGYEQESLSGSVGEMQTWRSVEDLTALGGGNQEKGRSRGTSNESAGFRFDDDEELSERSSGPPPPVIRLSAGYCSRMGPRSNNEDRCVAFTDLYQEVNQFMSSAPLHDHLSFYGVDRGPNWKELASPPRSESHTDAYFGVYDGHSGAVASQFLYNVLHHSIYSHPKFEEDLEAAITDTCTNIDRQFLDHCRAHSIYCGTTAVGALITEQGQRLTVFNIGDSEAVLSRGGKVLELTSKHSPNRDDERLRVLAAQGWITEEKELYYGRLHRMDLHDEYILERASDLQWTYIYRVCGEISVSRSIGDIPYKGFTPGEVVNEPFAWPDSHNQIFSADLVIPNPEFVSYDLIPEDEFMILASDGLWDVVKSQEACSRVRKSLELGKTPQEISEELSDLAIRLGSSDNVTIVIVQFHHF